MKKFYNLLKPRGLILLIDNNWVEDSLGQERNKDDYSSL